MLPLVLFLAAAPVDAPALLARARAQVANLEYRSAERTLQPVEQARDLSRADALAYFELEARIAGTLGRPEDAARWFERLVELDPAFSLGDRASPKLSGPLFEARAAVDKRGALGLTVRVTEAGGRVTALHPTLTGALDRLARVRLTLEEDGATRELELAPAASLAPVAVAAAVLGVKARLVDARGWTLVEHASRHEATPLPVAKPVATLTPADAPPPAPLVLAPLPPLAPSPRFRGLAWASFGVALAAAVTGGILYGLGFDAKQRFDGAVAARQGTLLTLTQAQAQQLDATARLGGVGSTVAWATAGGLLVTGVILWVLDGAAEAK